MKNIQRFFQNSLRLLGLPLHLENIRQNSQCTSHQMSMPSLTVYCNGFL